MKLLASTLKVVIGLAVFASLMMLEFNSYTRAVAEEVVEPIVLSSQTTQLEPTATTGKKSGKTIR